MYFVTVDLHFTEFIVGVIRIPLRIRPVSPVVVVDDVSSVVMTCDVDRIRYRGSGVVGVPKTQHSVLLVCCVGDVNRKAKKPTGESIASICNTQSSNHTAKSCNTPTKHMLNETDADSITS